MVILSFLSSLGLTIFAAVSGGALLYFVKHVTASAIDFDAWLRAMAILTALALAGLPLRPRDLVPGLRIFFRIMAIVPVVYFSFATPSFTGSEAQLTERGFELVRYFGMAMGLISLWCPSFLSAALYAIVLNRKVAAVAGGIELTPTDMLPAIETTSALLFALIAARWVSLLKPLRAHFGTVFGETAEQDPALRMPFQEALLILAISAHLANYYYSAHAKLVLNGGPFTWLLENPTSVLMENAWEMGFLPISHWNGLSELVLRLATEFNLVTNAFTLGIQVLAFVALLRRRWLIGILLAYDFMHLGIYVLTGIFFWKWMVLNAAIVAALLRARMPEISARIAVTAIACGILAPYLFFVADLGWYDTRQVADSHAVAITDDSREINVPSNYYLALSVAFAQMDYGGSLPGSQPDTKTWGSTMDYTIKQQGALCATPIGGEGSPERQEYIKHVLRMVHETALAAGGSDGVYNYDVYPHHIWSNPFDTAEFRDLDKRRIVAYRWVETVLCVDRLHHATGVQVERSMIVPVTDLR